MANPTDHLTTVRAALDLMLRVWPGPLDVRGFVDDTGNDAAAVIDVATGETIATCDNEDRDDHATPVEDARAIVALRNSAPAIADLCREVEAGRARIATLEAELAERSMLAAAYRSMALCGETPGDHDAEIARVRTVLAERAAKAKE